MAHHGRKTMAEEQDYYDYDGEWTTLEEEE